MRIPKVTVTTEPASPPNEVLDKALKKSGFWTLINERCRLRKALKKNFTVLIKPDLEVFTAMDSTGTDPALVEHLIALLHQHGYTRVVVADSNHDSLNWLDNRDTAIRADLAGYKYMTDAGNPYDIVSLSEEMTDGNFETKSILSGSSISRYWETADFRILFCKNKTDEEYYYSLCLKSLIDILPLQAKGYHYYFTKSVEEVAYCLYKRNDVDFCLIDAFASNHGIQGTRHQKTIRTNTIITGNHILLIDWIGSLKMGLDPYSSSLNAYALRKENLPKKYALDGPMENYSGWQNVTKIVAESVRTRNEEPMLRQLSKAWLQKTDTEIFPFKNVADAQVNQVISGFFMNIDDHPIAYNLMLAANYLMGRLAKAVNHWNAIFNKEKVFRKNITLGIDYADYAFEEFESLEEYVLQLAEFIKAALPDKNGLKWRYIDNSVLFEFKRIIPYGYKQFIERFDIAQSVEYMYDNVGCVRVPAKADKRGRVLHQMERDMYLSQPNWMILFGGKEIDVCKIERIRYRQKSQAIYWRTVESPNGSASFDDGLVEISEAGSKMTLIKIIARQQFSLPVFWHVFDIDYLPTIKDALVSDSYLRFFERTIANFEAVYEGRKPQIGHVAEATWEDYSKNHRFLQPEFLKNVFSVFTGAAEKLFKPAARASGESKNELQDEHGYRHSTHSGNATNEHADDIRSFIEDLSNAVQKDLSRIVNAQ